MTTRVRYPLGKGWIEVESESIVDAIKDLSEFTEVLGESVCGSCGADTVRPGHRTAKGYDFYEMVCLACGARLSFGQTRDGGKLFPKRKDQGGQELEKNGWVHYQPQQSNANGPPEGF